MYFVVLWQNHNSFRKIIKGYYPLLHAGKKQLIQLLAEGKTTVAIADELFLSRFTIDTYRKNLLQKFKVKKHNRVINVVGTGKPYLNRSQHK